METVGCSGIDSHDSPRLLSRPTEGGLAAAGESADGAAGAALGVDEGAAAVWAADVAREGESQLGAYELAHDRSPSAIELVC